jgi:hypothetical protein
VALLGVDTGETTHSYSRSMRVAIVTTSLAALLMLAGWAAGASPQLPPQCSPADTQRGRILHSEEFKAGGLWSARYCGPGRAVVRVGGKSFTIRGGRCTSRRVGFGQLGNEGRGISLVLGHTNRPGRNDVIDGLIQLPGVSSAKTSAYPGTVIKSKDLKSATFSIGPRGQPARITGSWICGLRI